MAEKVLFVDDEEFILDIAEALFADRGIDVLTANNAQDALKTVRNNEIAVLVSDNCMPGMKGMDLLSQVKVISPDTVKILMTGFADLDTAIEAINRVEVFRFIAKPWDNRQLVDVVEEALKRYGLIRSLKQGDEASVFSLVTALELKDPYTRGHSERVAEYALMIAEAMELKNIKEIRIGSWLHDCGKIGVSENILHYEGPLDEAELHIVRNHPMWGAEVARHAMLPDLIVNIVMCHHERYDGKGYPVGIKSDEIPIEARVVAVADVYDALTTKRPYRDAYDMDKALEILRSMSGNVLDPEIVRIFDPLVRAAAAQS